MRVPAYFDAILAAWRAGQAGRDVHLGYWDRPPGLDMPCTPAEFNEAQARMTRLLVGALPNIPSGSPVAGTPGPAVGLAVLDIACGLGGTLAVLNDRLRDARLTAVNIDPRQLAACRSIPPHAGNTLDLIAADACALPFANATQDHVLCVEAMFHFASRTAFLREVARVLRPGGSAVMTDILLSHPQGCPWPPAEVERILRRDYGPWPDPWADVATILHDAAGAGLLPIEATDWTAATLPSYRLISPHPAPERLGARADAGAVFRWLHLHGGLSYRMFRFHRSAR